MAKVDLRCRSNQSELMDTEPVAFTDFHKCLQELEIVNICTLAYRPTMRWLGHMLKGTNPGGPFPCSMSAAAAAICCDGFGNCCAGAT
jgi:hypothetical protein